MYSGLRKASSTPSSSRGKREDSGARESCWRFGKERRLRGVVVPELVVRIASIVSVQFLPNFKVEVQLRTPAGVVGVVRGKTVMEDARADDLQTCEAKMWRRNLVRIEGSAISSPNLRHYLRSRVQCTSMLNGHCNSC